MFGLMVLYVISGVLLVVLAIPLWQGKIDPNGLYGFRVKKTLENESIWVAVNKYIAPWLAAAGLATSLSAVCLYFVPGISLDSYAIGVLVVFLVVFVLGIARTVHFMNTLS